ncbi:MAG: putative Ig domain-containing protein [Verrucomicrobiales bacterium]
MADGGGRSLELVNAALPNEFGQNWAPSAAAGGTPAAANSAASGAEGPLILEATHAPAVPRSGQSVTVSARLVGGSSATLHWRASAESAPAFNQAAMADNGAFGDGDAGDGVFGAVIPAQPAGTVIEFYITARDASSNERAWPAPTDQGQTANALFQFDDEEWTGAPCIYRIVLTKAEEAEFAGIDRDSDAMMNATFIARTDSGFAVRYRSGVRVRGASSRGDDPVPLRLSLPADRPWDGMTDFNLNTQFTWLQYVGMKLFAACDLPAPMVRPVQVRLNGTNGATGEEEQFGSYVHVQPLNGEFVDQAFPGAEEGGNLYKKVRPDRDWSYRNGNITAYLSDGWSKQTNSSENDWSDLNAFLQTMSAGGGNPNYQADVEAIADVTQWLRWFAAMTLLNNGETNLSNGADDDYTFYFRPSDGRLMLIPHDLDTILGQGDGDRITSPSYTLFDMIEPGNRGDVLDDLTPFFAVPAFRDAYYGQLRELARTVFAAEKFGPAVDAWLGGWVPPDRIATIKAFMAARTAFVLNQAEQILGAAPPLPAPTAASEWDSGSAPAGVRLNEVLALNRSAYANGGAFPDAVELFNAGAAPVDLGGWALTDDPETPAKFVFPANTMIGAGAGLVLNADAAAGAGIHLGFNLSAKGGALILYDGGGAQADRVDFGPQAEDFSVGRSSANPAIWRLDEPTIGFPNGPGILPAQLGDPALVRINEWSGSPNYRLRRDFAELYNPGSLPAPLGGARLTDDPAFGSDSLTLPPLSFIGAGQFAEFGAALPFGLNGSGDWLALIGENGVAIDRVSLDCGRGDWSAGRIPDGGDAIAHLRLPTPGAPNQAEIVSESDAIGWNYDWRYEDNNVPQSAGWTDLGFDDSGWAVGEGALGLEFESIPVPIQTQLNFRPPLTHYFRHTFTIEDPAAGELFLDTEIDDGAVVYVNGRELARLRMPSGAVGHSTLADGFVSEASIEGPFRVPPGWLVPGGNVIAAEVHQERADSSDIVFALRARFVESEPPNAEFARALALINGLRISEIMFNPSGDQALEFIEIANVSMAALDLTGLRFEEGIQFTFPAMSLGAGEFLLVVRDAAAFAAEYGAGLPVAGEFTGALANGGELIRLELPGAFAGVAAAGFSYDDAWIPAADGGGASLVAARLTADPALWGEKASWKAGPIGGTPGNNGPPFFTNPLYATATQGAPFSFQLVAENGYSAWSVDDLPPGLSFNAATGIISGVPTGFGEAAVELNATNAAGTATSTLEIDIAQLTPPVITSAAAASGVLDEAFSYQITATNFPGSFDIGGQFPAGLSFDTNSGLLYGIPTEAGEFSVQVEASNIAGVGVAPVTITIQSDPLLASLETTLPLERGGDADWFAQSEVTHDGLDAARSGDIDDSEDSYMRAQIPGPDRLSFWWKVSSEQSFDYLDFRIDGVSQDRISGEVDWQEKLYDIPEGNHTIEWRFYKDGSVSDGDDAGYVDQVRLESDGGTPIIYSASRLGIFIGDSVDYQILATGNPDSITVENLPDGLQFNAAEYTITGTPENAGATTVLIRAENEAGEGTLGLLVEVFPEFNLGEALDWPSLRYRGNTDYLWFPSAAAFSFDGVDVARGGRPAEGEENWFEVDVEGPDTVVFWWRLLANSADSLSLFRDGELWFNIYGATDWERVEVSIPEGTHTLRWSFRDEGNSGGNSANLALVDRFRLVSQSAEPFINSATAATAVQGSPFTYQIAATNDPATFGATGLPAGLSVDAATGAITGTPAATGVFTVTLTASNAAGSDQSRLSLSIGPPLNFNVPLDTVGQIYSGMPSGIQWSVTPTSMDGISAVSSGNVPADTARYFEMQVEGPETVSFWWNFTEGSSSGQMIFYRDGSWWNSMSSEQGRRQNHAGRGEAHAALGGHRMEQEYRPRLRRPHPPA